MAPGEHEFDTPALGDGRDLLPITFFPRPLVCLGLCCGPWAAPPLSVSLLARAGTQGPSSAFSLLGVSWASKFTFTPQGPISAM